MPSERSLQHSSAANASWARTADRSARTAPAHAGRDRRIARDYGIPDELEHTNPADYARRLESAKKAHFGKLALRSVKARQKAKQYKAEADAADAELSSASDLPEAS